MISPLLSGVVGVLAIAMRRKWHSVCNVLSNLPGTWCALNKYEFGARPDESSPRVRHSRLLQSRLKGSVLSCLPAVCLLFSRSEGFPPGF